MARGITPKAQPLDFMVNKLFKVYYRDLYDQYMMNVPVSSTTGNSIAPSRQQISNWVVEDWEKIQEEIAHKAFLCTGYKEPGSKEDKECTDIVRPTTDDDHLDIMLKKVEIVAREDAAISLKQIEMFDGSDSESDDGEI
eukprot:3166002-Ditylum_brightwellii.AAC.1